MDTSKNIIKHIALKRPSKPIIIMIMFIVTVWGNFSFLLPDRFTNEVWISWLSIVLCICGLYIYKVYYTRHCLKNITIFNNDNIVLDYFYIQNWDTKSHDYATSRYIIKIEVKGNRVRLYEKGKPDYIAKIYKRTMKNKNDWEWLINYFDKVSE